jgi:hypothetical protein
MAQGILLGCEMIPPWRRQHHRPGLLRGRRSAADRKMRPQALERLGAKALDACEIVNTAECTIARPVVEDGTRLAGADARQTLQRDAVCSVQVDQGLRRRRCEQGTRKCAGEQTTNGQGTQIRHGKLRKRKRPDSPALPVLP